jgi:hypothetical protein
LSGSMYDPCEMLRQYKARAAQAVTSDPSQMFEGKASKTGGEILMSRKLKRYLINILKCHSIQLLIKVIILSLLSLM